MNAEAEKTCAVLTMLRGAMRVHRAAAGGDGDALAYYDDTEKALDAASQAVEGREDLERRLAAALEDLAILRGRMRPAAAVIVEGAALFAGPAHAFPAPLAEWVAKVQSEARRWQP
jgi:hypothetical protein